VRLRYANRVSSPAQSLGIHPHGVVVRCPQDHWPVRNFCIEPLRKENSTRSESVIESFASNPFQLKMRGCPLTNRGSDLLRRAKITHRSELFFEAAKDRVHVTITECGAEKSAFAVDYLIYLSGLC
jgi:hypothetical protein